MNKKGFTLVELLATIIVLALIFSITIYVTTNVITKSRENTYKVTMNEVEKNASSYLMENSNRLFYLTRKDKTDTEYQCITVENLMDYGFLDIDVTNSLIAKDRKVKKEDYIYIERDKNTMAITKSVYVMPDSEYITLCPKAVKATGDIAIVSNPNEKEWSKYKDITITYKLKNLNDQRKIDNYGFNHSYNGTSEYDQSNDTFSNNTKTKYLRVTSNGTLLADITYMNESDEDLPSASLVISTIDNTGPVITKVGTDNKTVRSTVTIQLKVTDVGIGVNYGSFTKDDIIVKVGDTTLTSGYSLTNKNNGTYDLKIDSDLYNGKVTLTIPQDKVFDMIENGNKNTPIDTGITFDNTYRIKYDMNGGSGTIADTTYVYATSGTVNLTTTVPSKKGHTFLGWDTNKSATTATYAKGAAYNKNIKKDVTLYAIWQANTYKITYDANGGSGAPSATTYTYADSGTFNLSSTKPSKKGHTFLGWNIDKNATTATYSAGASWNKNVDSNTTLYAIWKANTYKITYNANGGSGAPSATTYTYADSGTTNLSSTKPTWTGHNFLGWNTDKSATTAKYSAGQKWNLNNASDYTLYAIWEIASYTCSAGTYLKKSATSCTTCTKNYYCPGGTYKYNTTKDQGINPCASGKYTTGTGAKSASECLLCNRWERTDTQSVIANQKWRFYRDCRLISGSYTYTDYSGGTYTYSVINGTGWIFTGQRTDTPDGQETSTKRWYYLENDYMVVGWKKIGKYWYFFTNTDPDGNNAVNGDMIYDTSLKWNNKTYYFDKSGHCTNDNYECK